MRDGLPIPVAVSQVRNEGFYMLYRGVLSPLGMRASSLAIMFGSFGSYRVFFEKQHPQLGPHTVLVLSATLAGISEACFGVPFERVQTLLLDKKFNSRFQNTLHAVRHLWKQHPVKEFYRGASVIMFRNSLGNTMYFTAREHVANIFPTEQTTLTKFIVDFIK